MFYPIFLIFQKNHHVEKPFMKLGNFVNIIKNILKVNPWGGISILFQTTCKKNIGCNLLIFFINVNRMFVIHYENIFKICHFFITIWKISLYFKCFLNHTSSDYLGLIIHVHAIKIIMIPLHYNDILLLGFFY